jgi:hypothetical protein
MYPRLVLKTPLYVEHLIPMFPMAYFSQGLAIRHKSVAFRKGGSALHQVMRMFGLVLRHPMLIPGMVRASWVFRARNWYGRPPFLPIPPKAYVRWRMETAYGDPEALPPAKEMSRYLRWGKRIRRGMKEH